MKYLSNKEQHFFLYFKNKKYIIQMKCTIFHTILYISAWTDIRAELTKIIKIILYYIYMYIIRYI